MEWYEWLGLGIGVTALGVAGFVVVSEVQASNAQQAALVQAQLQAAARPAQPTQPKGSNTAATLLSAGVQLFNGLGGVEGIGNLLDL